MPDEWTERKKLTGVVAKLVTYTATMPTDAESDVTGLQRDRWDRVFVTAVASGGPAEHSGVQIGDQLVSVAGRRDFTGIATPDLLRNLPSPVSLIFLGFAGKLQAEVRLSHPDAPSCGLPKNFVLNCCTSEGVVFAQALEHEGPPAPAQQATPRSRSFPPMEKLGTLQQDAQGQAIPAIHDERTPGAVGKLVVAQLSKATADTDSGSDDEPSLLI